MLATRSIALPARGPVAVACKPRSSLRHVKPLNVAAPEKAEVVIAAMELEERISAHVPESQPSTSQPAVASQLDIEAAERKARRQREQSTYKYAAIAATAGVTGIAVLTTWLRFYWHLRDDGVMPWGELAATLSLVAGGVFAMEMWARWAHKVLWHDFEPGWALHKSHHMPRTGPFEANDIYAIMNAVPAMALCLYGFITPNIVGGLCFGAGLGITLFGIMYMFVHDGLVHRRFPTGPVGDLPYMKRIAVAHQLHHSGKYGGAPWGMFLGVQELDAIPGAREDLERLVENLDAQGGLAALERKPRT
uniref:beta-carotene 3-hydroxylase n=1 Tax=Chlamydomonas leiostraca TaxID=1034604 RepID=A0A7S0S1S3_9CHLO|mmetsp:Transcript_4306/g.10722  ORF Transcript_4306/g.10722 Transcript_4306/m.10722 type:complete len:306 (+) Transcript_4306:151-1068(+)